MIAGVKRLTHTEDGKDIQYINKKMLRYLERIILRRVKNVVVVSQELKSMMSR